jgi:uncharacterized protein affecting Mg2+/Co2+ transport
MSTGYALFSQNLSINANATKPAYTSSQYLFLSYTRSVAPSGSNWRYTYSVTVKNTSSTRTISAWQATFSLPSGYSSVNCTNAGCSQASNVNTAVNTGTNGTINPNGTVTFTFAFTAAQQNYRFSDISVSGTVVPIYQTVTGLTVSVSAGTRVKNKNIYTWPYTITVTNNSGQDLAGWRLLIPWTNSESVDSIPATVNYVATATQLQITSKQGISNGANFQFIASLSSTNSGWSMSGQTVQGDYY